MDARLPPGLAGLWRALKVHSGYAHGLLQAHSPLLVLGQVMAAARIDLQQRTPLLIPIISRWLSRADREHMQALA